MLFSIDNLRMLGFSEEMINIWKKSGITQLLPVQQQVLSQPEFFSKPAQMIIAPTSSGKTLVAQIAALYHLKDMRKVVYLVPTKALAEEKYKSFEILLSPLGFKVKVSTRDRDDQDEDIIAGNFDLLVTVYEKLKAFLIFKPEMLSSLSLLIADEIQLLNDTERGGMVDVILSKVLFRRSDMKTLFLSAVVGAPERFAKWLGIKPFVINERPVELREGIFVINSGAFLYRDFNSGEKGEEHLFYESRCPDNDYQEAHLELARYLSAENGEQVIVFLPMKYLTIKWAAEFAENVHFNPAHNAINAIKSQEDSILKGELLNMLNSGIGFHNSDLSFDTRKIMEKAFEDGEIRVLFSTSTLAQGVNIGGRNVICSSKKIGRDEITGRTTEQNLQRFEFKNQGGRAGRYGRENNFGRAILLAADHDEAEKMMREYITKDLEPITSVLKEHDYKDAFLDLLETGMIHNENEWIDFVSSTYCHFSKAENYERSSRNDYADIYNRLHDELLRDNLIKSDTSGEIKPTAAGKISTAFGFNTKTTLLYLDVMSTCKERRISNPEYIFTASDTPDAREISIPLRRGVDTPYNLLDALNDAVNSAGIYPSGNLENFLAAKGGLAADDLQVIKRALIIYDWISSLPTFEIEKKWGVHLGMIQNLAQNFEWLIQGWGKLAEAMAMQPACVKDIHILSKRIRYGVPASGLIWAKLNIPEITRQDIQNLIEEGYDTLQSVWELESSDPIKKILGINKTEELFTRIHFFHKQKIESEQHQIIPAEVQSQPVKIASSLSEIKIEIDGKSPGFIYVNEKLVELNQKAYKLLEKLAKQPGILCKYEDIDEAIWPDTKVERQQITQHKTHIISQIKKVVNPEIALNLIKTKSGFGLILQIEKENITFRN